MLGESAFIDELQRAPELVLALKSTVDRDARPGRFLVSGSASLLLAPRIADSLTGRMEPVPLRPFTQAEIARRPVPPWLDELWDGGGPPNVESESESRATHAERIAAGGFPSVIARSERRRGAWFEDYLAALVARDVPDLVAVRRPDLLPVLLVHLAAGSGSLISMRPLARSLAADEKTVRAYVRLLELLHLTSASPLGRRASPRAPFARRDCSSKTPACSPTCWKRTRPGSRATTVSAGAPTSRSRRWSLRACYPTRRRRRSCATGVGRTARRSTSC